MVTMILLVILAIWTVLGIAFLIGLALRGEGVFDAIGFVGLIWIVLIVTTVISGMVEKQYQHLC